MKSRKTRKLAVLGTVYVLSLGAAACTAGASGSTETAAVKETAAAGNTDTVYHEAVNTAAVTSGGAIDASDLFTERDLTQTADLSEAVYYNVSDGEDITVSEEGVYVFSGTAEEVTIIVEADSEDKVQLVLDGLNVENSNSPVIYVKSADKVFVTSEGENSLTVSGSFAADGETNTDAVIFSKDDLVLNGTGTISIVSSDNGISCKDDLKITGGTVSIRCASDAVEANDSVLISDGNITIVSDKDGIHAENDEDDTLGYVYICGGTIGIQASDDGIHGTTVVQVDGGTLDITAAEGIEATWVQINDGIISISASDDGINAGRKSTACSVLAEINGGDLTIKMGAGDTDAIDSNGNLIVSGGTIDITANSAFDFDGSVSFTGGTVIVNGTVQNTIANSMMGGGMGGQGMPGGMQGGAFGEGQGMNGGMPGGKTGKPGGFH